MATIGPNAEPEPSEQSAHGRIHHPLVGTEGQVEKYVFEGQCRHVGEKVKQGEGRSRGQAVLQPNADSAVHLDH